MAIAPLKLANHDGVNVRQAGKKNAVYEHKQLICVKKTTIITSWASNNIAMQEYLPYLCNTKRLIDCLG